MKTLNKYYVIFFGQKHLLQTFSCTKSRLSSEVGQILRKTEALFRSGCDYARVGLLPAVWEEVRQREKSNDFPSVGFQRTVSCNLYVQSDFRSRETKAAQPQQWASNICFYGQGINSCKN